jgi:hypothetical protein
MTIYSILMSKYRRLLTNDYQISTKDYVRNYKQIMQNKPNSPNVQMNVTYLTTMYYIIFISLATPKTKPIQSQFKPKQTQFNPIQSQFKPNLSKS